MDEDNELLICANNRIYKLTSDSNQLGDINSDNQINILDIVNLINFILNNEFLSVADINGIILIMF